VGLVARHLESNGIPTVVVGAARDIIEHCGVPRFLYTDFPLGNPCGRPWHAESQREIVTRALALLETATAPRAILQTPFVWSDDDTWRDDYLRIDDAQRAKLEEAGERRRAKQARAKSDGTARSD
jgi:hypothetical protein